MNTRPLDKSKKSNIKCEHCLFYDKPTQYDEKPWCCLHETEKNYWNRCKDFKWSERYAK